jgi:hypothetical protein
VTAPVSTLTCCCPRAERPHRSLHALHLASTSQVFGIGSLGLRLAVAFLGVALASIIVLSYITEISTGHEVNGLAQQRERAQSRSVAVAAGGQRSAAMAAGSGIGLLGGERKPRRLRRPI